MFWTGSSKEDLLAFPEVVIDEIGTALSVALFGGKHASFGSSTGLRTVGFGLAELVTWVYESDALIVRVPNAEEKRTKVRLAVTINQIIQEQALSPRWWPHGACKSTSPKSPHYRTIGWTGSRSND
jgi:hypothetical protein